MSREPDAPSRDWPFDLPKVTTAKRKRASALLAELDAHYPDAHCELDYCSPHELLVATILSAQATDASVNKATPALFAAFPTPAHYARSSPDKIEPYIRSIGLFRNKAKAVHAAMKEVCERFGGEVPRTMDELLTLRGVARKTANVVLGNAFSVNVGFVVDTHIERLSKRFGLVPPEANVMHIERHLMALFPRQRWCQVSHMLIWHGRRACRARLPGCSGHPVCKEFGGCCELRISAKATKTATVAKPPRTRTASKGHRGTQSEPPLRAEPARHPTKSGRAVQ